MDSDSILEYFRRTTGNPHLDLPARDLQLLAGRARFCASFLEELLLSVPPLPITPESIYQHVKEITDPSTNKSGRVREYVERLYEKARKKDKKVSQTPSGRKYSLNNLLLLMAEFHIFLQEQPGVPVDDFAFLHNSGILMVDKDMLKCGEPIMAIAILRKWQNRGANIWLIAFSSACDWLVRLRKAHSLND